ncbi:hypothetical protein [Streptomyces phaeochromogenes]
MCSVDANRPAEAETWLRHAVDEEDAEAVLHLDRLPLFSGMGTKPGAG